MAELTGYEFLCVSDVQRDGVGVELWNATELLAEIFRSDCNKVVSVSTFNNDIQKSVFMDFLAYARRKLVEYEDGTKIDWNSNI